MITVSVIVTLIGLILYLWSPNPKTTRIGEICFFAGLLAALFSPLGSRVLI